MLVSGLALAVSLRKSAVAVLCAKMRKLNIRIIFNESKIFEKDRAHLHKRAARVRIGSAPSNGGAKHIIRAGFC